MLKVRLHRKGCLSFSIHALVWLAAYKNPSLQTFSTHYTEKRQISVVDLKVNIL